MFERRRYGRRWYTRRESRLRLYAVEFDARLEADRVDLETIVDRHLVGSSVGLLDRQVEFETWLESRSLEFEVAPEVCNRPFRRRLDDFFLALEIVDRAQERRARFVWAVFSHRETSYA